MLQNHTTLCGYYYYLIYKVKMNKFAAEQMCETLRDLQKAKKIGSLLEFFEVPSNYPGDLIPYEGVVLKKDISYEDIIDLESYETYGDYLRVKLSMAISRRAVFVKLVQSGEYDGRVSFGLSGIYIYKKNGEKVEFHKGTDIALKAVNDNLRITAKALEIGPCHYRVAEMLHIDSSKYDKIMMDNLDSYGADLRYIKATFTLGLFMPKEVNEVKLATDSFKNISEEVPIIIQELKRNGEKVDFIGRYFSPMNVETMEYNGFDHYNFISNHNKLLLRTKKFGIDVDDWNDLDEYQAFIKRVEDKNWSIGDKFVYNSKWKFVKGAAIFDLLSKSELFFVGRSGDSWDWVGKYVGIRQVTRFLLDDLFRCIPRLYQAMCLFSLKMTGANYSAVDLLSKLMMSYGLPYLNGKFFDTLKLVLDETVIYDTGFQNPNYTIGNKYLSGVHVLDSYLNHNLDISKFDLETSVIGDNLFDYKLRFFGKVMNCNDEYISDYDMDKNDDISNNIDDLIASDEGCVDNDEVYIVGENIEEKRTMDDRLKDGKCVDIRLTTSHRDYEVVGSVIYASIREDQSFVLSKDDVSKLTSVKWDERLCFFFLYNYLYSQWTGDELVDIERIIMRNHMFVFLYANHRLKKRREIKHNFDIRFNFDLIFFDKKEGYCCKVEVLTRKQRKRTKHNKNRRKKKIERKQVLLEIDQNNKVEDDIVTTGVVQDKGEETLFEELRGSNILERAKFVKKRVRLSMYHLCVDIEVSSKVFIWNDEPPDLLNFSFL
jgi:hypothetical protein